MTPTPRPFARLIVLAVALGIAFGVQHFFGSHQVSLLVMIPKASDDGSGVTVRITRASDRKLVVQTQLASRPTESPTVSVSAKIPRGRYVADVWLENATRTPFTSAFDFAGEDMLEVQLAPR